MTKKTNWQLYFFLLLNHAKPCLAVWENKAEKWMQSITCEMLQTIDVNQVLYLRQRPAVYSSSGFVLKTV